MTVIKTISLTEDLDRYLRENKKNLSQFVQEKLKEEIIAKGKAQQYNIEPKLEKKSE
jgi:hypothetical protein